MDGDCTEPGVGARNGDAVGVGDGSAEGLDVRLDVGVGTVALEGDCVCAGVGTRDGD